MAIAGEQVLECMRVLGNTGDSIVAQGLNRARVNSLRSAFSARYDPKMSVIQNEIQGLLEQAETLRRRGELERAEGLIREVLADHPNIPQAYSVLHKTLMDAGRYADALDSIQHGIALDPNNPDFLYSQALTQQGLGQLTACIVSAQSALKHREGWLAPASLEASALRLMGHGSQAVDILRSLLDTEPDNTSLWGKLLLALHGDDRATLKDIAEAAKHASTSATQQGQSLQVTAPDPDRPLKLAFVSGDFREHPVAYFLEGILGSLNRDAFHVTLIPTISGSDARTDLCREACDTWHPIFNMTDDEAASSVHALNIDIAIDLSGWTNGHRLGLFNKRIAPLQATWIGYSGTTGLASMDYIICDDTVLPVTHEPHYSETPLRLPHTYLCMPTPKAILERVLGTLPPRPAPQQDRVVFGSFNTLAKLTDQVLDAWTQIIQSVEGSILYLRARQFNDDGVKADMVSRLQARNFPMDRLVLEGNASRKGMLAGYMKMDIALDPFPYGGTTTTFEALSMGVPMITLAGDRWVSLVGASLLKALGLDDLITTTVDDYVCKAIDLASDMPRLTTLRSTIADDMAQSPACDTAAFTRDLEHLLRAAWRKACDAA